MFYVNLRNMQDNPTYELEALAHHEGIPGHHMQIAIAQELNGFRSFGNFRVPTPPTRKGGGSTAS
jgi:Uncharacterized protein conserved in bacteria